MTRLPNMGMTMAYGTPGMIVESPPIAPGYSFVVPPPEKRRLRVSAAIEDGGVRVKVTLDGALVSETLTPGASLTVEADV